MIEIVTTTLRRRASVLARLVRGNRQTVRHCNADLPVGRGAVAQRDGPNVAEQWWTFHSAKGPNAATTGKLLLLGIRNFSNNVPGTKALLTPISQREVQEQLATASNGFDSRN